MPCGTYDLIMIQFICTIRAMIMKARSKKELYERLENLAVAKQKTNKRIKELDNQIEKLKQDKKAE